MRKLLAICVLLLATAPFAAGAEEDIPDGADCQAGTAAPFTHHYQSLEDPATADPSNADRSSTCIYAGGTVVFFIGGELQSETEPGFGGTCGSIIVAGMGVDSGTGQNWHNPGPDREWGTEDDNTCD